MEPRCGDNVDFALAASAEGMRALKKLSLAGLGVTAVIQLAVVLTSGSVALVAETIHNSGWRMPAPGGRRRMRTRSGHLG